MKMAVFFLLLLTAYVESDRKRLQIRPKGMENFDLQKFMGTWYLYASTFTCSWHGAYKFTDWYYIYRIDDKKQQGFARSSIWRKDGFCTYTESTATMTSTASFDIVDQIGGVSNGERVYVYTDYRNYVIMWLCSKKDVEDSSICDDYLYAVKTRHPRLKQQYLDEINTILNKLWGTSTADMELILHNNTCEIPATDTGKMFSTY